MKRNRKGVELTEEEKVFLAIKKLNKVKDLFNKMLCDGIGISPTTADIENNLNEVLELNNMIERPEECKVVRVHTLIEAFNSFPVEPGDRIEFPGEGSFEVLSVEQDNGIRTYHLDCAEYDVLFGTAGNNIVSAYRSVDKLVNDKKQVKQQIPMLDFKLY